MADNTTFTGLGVDFTAQTTDLQSKLNAAKEQIKAFAKELESLGTTGSKAYNKLTDAQKEEIKQAKESLNQANKAIDAAEKKLKATVASNKILSNSAKEVADAKIQAEKELEKAMVEQTKRAAINLERIKQGKELTTSAINKEIELTNKVAEAQKKVTEAKKAFNEVMGNITSGKDVEAELTKTYNAAEKAVVKAEKAVTKAAENIALATGKTIEDVKKSGETIVATDKGIVNSKENVKKAIKDVGVEADKFDSSRRTAAAAERIDAANKVEDSKKQLEFDKRNADMLDEINRRLANGQSLTKAQKTFIAEAAKAQLEATKITDGATKSTAGFSIAMKESEKELDNNTKSTKLLTAAQKAQQEIDDKKAEILANQTAAQRGKREQDNLNAKAYSKAMSSLTADLQEMSKQADISSAVMGELAKRLNKGANESSGYKKALIDLAKQSGDSELKFRTFADALNVVEKHILKSKEGFATIREQFVKSGQAIPAAVADYDKYAASVDRVKMTHENLSKLLSRTGETVVNTNQAFVPFFNAVERLKTVYGELAWSSLGVNESLGKQIGTVGALKDELGFFKQNTIGSTTAQILANKAIKQTAGSMNELASLYGLNSEVGTAWANGVNKQAVAAAFLRGEVYNANGQFLDMKKTSQEVSKSLQDFEQRAKSLGAEGIALHEDFGKGIKTWDEYDRKLKELAQTKKQVAAETKILSDFEWKAKNDWKASAETIADYSSKIKNHNMDVRDASRALIDQNKQSTAASKLLQKQALDLDILRTKFHEVLAAQGAYGDRARLALTEVDGSNHMMTKQGIVLQQLTSDLRAAEAGIKNYGEACSAAISKSSQSSAFITDLNKAIASGQITHAEAIKSLDSFVKKVTEVGTSSNMVGNFWQGFMNKISGGGATAVKVTGYMTNLGRSVATLAAWMPAAMIIQTVTDAISGTIAAITAYDQALKSLQAISGGTNAEIALLGDELLRISTQTKYSAKEIGDGAIFIAQAGFSAGESLKVIGAAARGAQGTLESLSIASDLLTTVIRVFKKDASEASYIMDMLAVAANASKTNLEGMKIVFNYLGPSAYAVKLTINETLGAMMALSNAGMRMSTVGTSLRQIFIGLEAPSSKLKEMLKTQGMTIADLSVKTQGGLIPVLNNLNKVIGGNLTNAVNAFNVRTASAALLLTTMKEHVGLMIGATDEWGASSVMAAKQTESLSISFDKLVNKFNAVMIKLGEGGLTDLTKLLVGALSKLVDVLEFLINNSIAKFITIVGAMYVAVDFLYLGLHKLYTIAIVGWFGKLTQAIDLTKKSVVAQTIALGALNVMEAQNIAISGNLTKVKTAAAVATTAWGYAVLFLKRCYDALMANKIVALLVGLATILATLYTIITAEQKHGAELQKQVLQYSENVESAKRYGEALATLRDRAGDSASKLFDHTAIMKQMIDSFPELAAEIQRTNGNFNAQIAIMNDLAIAQQKLADSKATKAMIDLGQQFDTNALKMKMYTEILDQHNASFFEGLNQQATALDISASAVAGTALYLGSVIGGIGANLLKWSTGIDMTNVALAGTRIALDMLAKMQVEFNLYFALSLDKRQEIAGKAMNELRVDQARVLGEMKTMVVSVSDEMKQSIIDSVPAGDYRKKLEQMVEDVKKARESLKDTKQTPAERAEFDKVAALGKNWEDYYESREGGYKGHVAALAKAAEDAAEKERKRVVKELGNSKETQAQADAAAERVLTEHYDKMLKTATDKTKALTDAVNKLYEDNVKKRKALLDEELAVMKIHEQQALSLIDKKDLSESAVIEQQSKIESEYFAKSIEKTKEHLDFALKSANAEMEVKKKLLAANKMLSTEAAKAELVKIEKYNAEQIANIYKESIETLKSFINEKIKESTRYKNEQIALLKEIEQAERDYNKTIMELDKIRRDAKRLTMTPSQVSADKELEFIQNIQKINAALAEAQKATSEDVKKTKINDAKEILQANQSMISGILGYDSSAASRIKSNDEEILRSKKKLEELSLQSSKVETIEEGKLDDSAKEKKKADLNEVAKEKARLEEYIRTLEKDTASLANKHTEATATKMKELADMLDPIAARIKQVAEEGKKAAADAKAAAAKQADSEIAAAVKSVDALLAKMKEQVAIKFDGTQAEAEIRRLIKVISDEQTAGNFKINIQFEGSASPPGPLAEVIERVKGMVGDFQKWMLENQKSNNLVINFKGFGTSAIEEYLSTAYLQAMSGATWLSQQLAILRPAFIVDFTGYGVAVATEWLSAAYIKAQSGAVWLYQQINSLRPAFIVDFKGSDSGVLSGFSSVVNAAIAKMNELFVASNRTAVFTVLTNNVSTGGKSGPSSSGESSTPSESNAYGAYAEGGPVPGTGSGDTVPAMLTPGEFVVNAPTVKGLGEGFFHFINSLRSFSMPSFNMGAVPAFANGGLVKNTDHGTFTLNLQAGSATMPLKVVGNPATMRTTIKMFEKELSRMKLSRA